MNKYKVNDLVWILDDPLKGAIRQVRVLNTPDNTAGYYCVETLDSKFDWWMEEKEMYETKMEVINKAISEIQKIQGVLDSRIRELVEELLKEEKRKDI